MSNYSLEELNSLKKTELENIAMKSIPGFNKNSRVVKRELIKMIWDHENKKDDENDEDDEISEISYRARPKKSGSPRQSRSKSRTKSPPSSPKPPRSRSRSKSRKPSPSPKPRSRSRSKSRPPKTKPSSPRKSKSQSPKTKPSRRITRKKSDDTTVDLSNLSKITLVELKKIAKQYGIGSLHTYNKSNRQQLEELIRQKTGNGGDVDVDDIVDVVDEKPLERKTLKELRQLLIERGITENLPKTKKDMIQLLQLQRCDPEQNILCDDGFCEVPNKICVDKIKKGYEEIQIDGKRVVGNPETIQKLKDQLKRREPSPPPSPPSLPSPPEEAPPEVIVYNIVFTQDGKQDNIEVESFDELQEFFRSNIQGPFKLLLNDKNGKEIRSTSDLYNNMRIFVDIIRPVAKKSPPQKQKPKSPQKGKISKDDIHSYLQDISTEDNVDLSHLDALQKQLIQCLFKPNQK